MTEQYCPNCNCPKCQPIEEGFEVENQELRNKVFALQNHIIGLEKQLAEYVMKSCKGDSK